MSAFEANNTPKSAGTTAAPEPIKEDPVLLKKLCEEFPDAYSENGDLVTLIAKCALLNRNNDYPTAKERLENYIKWRAIHLNDIGMKDQELTDAMKAQISTNFFQIVHNANFSNIEGASESLGTVFYVQGKYHDSSKYDALTTARVIHYMVVDMLRKNPHIAQYGCVAVNNMEGMGLSNVDRSLPDIMDGVVQKWLPLRLLQAAVCNPPFIVKFLIPIMKMRGTFF